MHETHLMKRVVRMVEDRLKETSGMRPLIIRLQVNAWSHLANQVGEADSPLHWAFSQAVQGTVAEGARLELMPAPSRSSCPACGGGLHDLETIVVCPACGRPAEDAGAELVLREIVVEED